jgi:hypothetical protein
MAAAGQILELVSTKEIELLLSLINARDRLRRRIPSLDASLVWNRKTLEAVGVLAKSFSYVRNLRLSVCRGYTDNRERHPISTGSVGLQFVLNSVAKASARQPFTNSAKSPEAPVQQSFGLTPVPRTTSLGFSTSALALKS